MLQPTHNLKVFISKLVEETIWVVIGQPHEHLAEGLTYMINHA
jgi:hypothetical protein